MYCTEKKKKKFSCALPLLPPLGACLGSLEFLGEMKFHFIYVVILCLGWGGELMIQRGDVRPWL